MKEIKARGIVLRESISGDADKVITIFAKDIGKISAYCPGARNTRSRLLSATAMFNYADFTLYKSAKGYRLAFAEGIQSFYALREDFAKLSYAAFFAELADKSVPEHCEHNDILQLLLKALMQLNKAAIPLQLISDIYIIKLMQYSGFMPDLSGCCICGADKADYICSEGLLCAGCAGGNKKAEINADTIYILLYIFKSDLKQLFLFSTNEQCANLLHNTAALLIEAHIGYKPKTYKFIEDNDIY